MSLLVFRGFRGSSFRVIFFFFVFLLGNTGGSLNINTPCASSVRYTQRRNEGRQCKEINKLREREKVSKGESGMLCEHLTAYYLIIAAPGGCRCNRIHNHHSLRVHSFFKYLFFSSSLNVKLSHDATCVPSTCSDNDGHPERSSTIVPGEPTGKGGSSTFTSWLLLCCMFFIYFPSFLQGYLFV